MNWDEYANALSKTASGQGQSDEQLTALLAYAKPIFDAGLPVIFSAEHLASLLGLEYAGLVEALTDRKRLYRTYPVAKRAGGYRTISEPQPTLRAAQLWVLRHILDLRNIDKHATGFCRGRSIRDNALPHAKRKRVLSLDIYEFFPSVGAASVSSVFANIGYSGGVVSLLVLLVTLPNGLPQGAPTSPALSNLVMASVDKELLDLSERLEIQYTRYADDLTFSGSFRVGHVIREVRGILERAGFALNERKTRLMGRHQCQEVTGVVVNEFAQASRKLRRQLRQEAYFIARFGVDQHVARLGPAHRNRAAHLRGLADFVRFLNPRDRDALRLIEALGDRGTQRLARS